MLHLLSSLTSAMDESQIASLLKSSELFLIPQGVKLSYGTAGFRADAKLLESTVYRVGILSALRSLKLGSVTVGLMIIASHNKVSDNGIKVADPSGGMLSQEWEPLADQIANASSPRELVSLIREFVEKEEITIREKKKKCAEVWLGGKLDLVVNGFSELRKSEFARFWDLLRLTWGF